MPGFYRISDQLAVLISEPQNVAEVNLQLPCMKKYVSLRQNYSCKTIGNAA